jgi:membrane protein implicated in regulation of membrane protease activity
VIGALYALALLGAMTIGIFVLPVAVVATVLIGRRRRARVGRPGLVSGTALPLMYVAYLNRDGPGTVCSAIAGGQSCVDEWSPWPWLAVGLALLVAGAIVFARGRKSLPPGSAATNADP